MKNDEQLMISPELEDERMWSCMVQYYQWIPRKKDMDTHRLLERKHNRRDTKAPRSGKATFIGDSSRLQYKWETSIARIPSLASTSLWLCIRRVTMNRGMKRLFTLSSITSTNDRFVPWFLDSFCWVYHTYVTTMSSSFCSFVYTYISVVLLTYKIWATMIY